MKFIEQVGDAKESYTVTSTHPILIHCQQPFAFDMVS